MRTVLSLLLAAVLAPLAAADLGDLGQGLGYLRVHASNEALTALATDEPLVLDLRHATVSPEGLAAFATALATRHAPVRLFVLVGPDTPATFAPLLSGPLVTLGLKESTPTPQVIVAQTPEADRAAYDALTTGTPLADLVSGRIEKERYDEATLVQEFNEGYLDAQPPAPPAADAATPAPARLTDLVLQRAVHLHRALLALRR